MNVTDEQIAMMQAVTGASASTCAQYLRATNGDIDAACELLYAAPPEDAGEAERQRRPSPTREPADDIGFVTPQYASTLSSSGPSGGGGYVPAAAYFQDVPPPAARRAPQPFVAPAADPFLDLDAQMRAASAHLQRIGQTHLMHRTVTPERDFGALNGLFAPPRYAATGTLREACAQAARDNRWVIINVLGEDFDSGCLNRDIWKNENVHQLVDCYFTLWQAPGEEATQVAANYRLSQRGFYFPHVFIVNPFTRAFVRDIPVKKIKSNVKDGTGAYPFQPDKMIDALWKFFEDTGLPQDVVGPGGDRATPPPAATPPQAPIEVVDDDNDGGDDDDAALQAALAASAAVEQPAPAPVDVDLAAMCVAAGAPDSLRLRIKLPSGPWDLVLPKSVTVSDFAAGIRTKLRALGTTTSVGPLSLMVGFPPKKVYDEATEATTAATATLADLAGLRSGDVVTPHF